MGPTLDTRYVTLVLRVRGRHVGMAHLRGRVRVVRIVGRGYVLHGRKGWLQFVVSDYLLWRPVFPGSLGDRLLRAVSFVRPLDFLVVSAKRSGNLFFTKSSNFICIRTIALDHRITC